MTELDGRISELALAYLPIAADLLRDLVRVPADYVGLAREAGGDPQCGLSNHEGPRLALLAQRLVEIAAVRSAEDVTIDPYGNLVWVVDDPDDGMRRRDKRVIYLDGHSDTVAALREQWHARTGGALDPYEGVLDAGRLDRARLRRDLGFVPPDERWEHLLFGRGAADQLGGVVAQAVACKILLELAPVGALRGVIVRSYATVTEEDNDGGGPQYLARHVFPGAAPELLPDAVILTEGTGNARAGVLGIYRGQRGRMQIEVTVTGKSCHGSTPSEGRNPLEHGGAILAEAALQAAAGFADHPFVGQGTRTASWCRLETPSDCAVPERFVFRLDRRLAAGETPEEALLQVETLEAVRVARDAGLTVDISVPRYETPTWRDFRLDNPQIYRGWVTPADHPALASAVAAYRGAVTPTIAAWERDGEADLFRSEPRVDRWFFSTDGVGFSCAAEGHGIDLPASKRWVQQGDIIYPPMFGLGPGIEQNTHKIGECLDLRELRLAIAFLASFPHHFANA
ncbi:MAG: peptidase dimerization domain-containing protein [Candidatus Schekmanbacteria bacterium]|nr:peptidase dimerization domain-containing protein [Candidatus Schekmanbacteria bacterium]